jgi:PST family polysaccharide transporter
VTAPLDPTPAPGSDPTAGTGGDGPVDVLHWSSDDDVVESTDLLGHSVRRGLKWSFANTAVSRLANFLVGVAVARILVPKDFGVFAVALVVLQLLLSLNDSGVSSAIVSWPGKIEEIAATGATLIMVATGILYAALFLTAPLLADAFNVPQAADILRVLALGVVIDAFFAVPSASITRSFNQHHRAIADGASLVVSSVVLIVLAIGGLGTWALVWGQLVGVLVGGLVILALAPMKLHFGWDRAIAAKLLRFGLPLTGSALFTFVMLNTDYIVIGSVLGSVALGFYYLAFNISSWPVNTLSFTVRRVSMAGFARLQDNAAQMHAGFCTSMRILGAAAFPICALLAVFAPAIVRVVYGDNWLPAAETLRWLAALGAIRIVAELGNDYLVAAQRPHSVFVVQASWVVVLVPALIAGAHLDGIDGVGIGHVLVGLAVGMPVTMWALATTGLRVRAVLACFIPGIAMAAVAALIGLLALELFGENLPGLLTGGGICAVCVAVGVLVWRRFQAARDAITRAFSLADLAGADPAGPDLTAGSPTAPAEA